MMKEKLIVWGGFWEEKAGHLEIKDLNSHASVTCYFLTKALSQRFDVVQLASFQGVDEALEYPGAIGIISCFQAGFTKLESRKPYLFRELSNVFKGKLASIVDRVSLQRYSEDYLFTVLPPEKNIKGVLKRVLLRPKFEYLGWNASVEHCIPEVSDVPTIFLDHGHYCGDDYTGIFISALNKLTERLGSKSFRAYYQGNEGVQELLLPTTWEDEVYLRSRKVPWIELQSIYRRCAAFCVTHKESAGLGAIEAALAGAKLIVPFNNGSFIHEDLLSAEVDFARVCCTEDSILDALLAVMDRGIAERFNAHLRMLRTHSWDCAAVRVAKSDFCSRR